MLHPAIVKLNIFHLYLFFSDFKSLEDGGDVLDWQQGLGNEFFGIS